MCEQNFRNGVKTIIAENGFKQKAIAERANIEPDVFSKIVTGKRRIFADEAGRICNALGYTFEAIVEKGKESAWGEEGWKII